MGIAAAVFVALFKIEISTYSSPRDEKGPQNNPAQSPNWPLWWQPESFRSDDEKSSTEEAVGCINGVPK
jgi:hypothetical protein